MDTCHKHPPATPHDPEHADHCAALMRALRNALLANPLPDEAALRALSRAIARGPDAADAQSNLPARQAPEALAALHQAIDAAHEAHRMSLLSFYNITYFAKMPRVEQDHIAPGAALADRPVWIGNQQVHLSPTGVLPDPQCGDLAVRWTPEPPGLDGGTLRFEWRSTQPWEHG